jgi:hypothetical protein
MIMFSRKWGMILPPEAGYEFSGSSAEEQLNPQNIYSADHIELARSTIHRFRGA